MAWSEVAYFLNKLFDRKVDPRTEDWFLLANPLPTLFLCLSYVYFVKHLGPNLMKNREPFNIRWLMIIYNFTMVIVNIILFYIAGVYAYFGKYSFRCQPVDYSSSPEALIVLNASWWFYVTKFIDFTDTIFFVLRKKFNHITTLHVVHHGIMPMSIWFGLKFAPGGNGVFFAFINTFVHVLMYSYYGLAAIGPHMNKYLWWKKYLTTIQMIQFLIVLVHSLQLLFIECDYPKVFVWIIGFHAVLFLFLFSDFYKSAYLTNKDAEELKWKMAESNGKLPKNGHISKNMNGYGNHCELLNNNNECKNELSTASDLIKHNEEKKVR